MDDMVVLALAKDYANGIATSIQSISVNGNEITFETTGGQTYQVSLNAVKNAEIDDNNHLIITLTDDSEIDAGLITIEALGVLLDTPLNIGGVLKDNVEDALHGLDEAKQNTDLSTPLDVGGFPVTTVEDALSAIYDFTDSKISKDSLGFAEVYIDAVNGDDDNVGDFDHPLQTVEAAYYYNPVALSLRLIFKSDYTADFGIADFNGLIPAVTLTSADPDNPVTISGKVRIGAKAYVGIDHINFTDDVENDLDNPYVLYITDSTDVVISHSNISVQNNYMDSIGYGIELEGVAKCTIKEHVNISVALGSTKVMKAPIIALRSNLTVRNGHNAFGDGVRVITLYEGSTAYLNSDFLDRSYSQLNKVLTNAEIDSSVWYLDGQIQDQDLIPLTTLKSIVADSSDFADFQSKIGAL